MSASLFNRLKGTKHKADVELPDPEPKKQNVATAPTPVPPVAPKPSPATTPPVPLGATPTPGPTPPAASAATTTPSAGNSPVERSAFLKWLVQGAHDRALDSFPAVQPGVFIRLLQDALTGAPVGCKKDLEKACRDILKHVLFDPKDATMKWVKGKGFFSAVSKEGKRSGCELTHLVGSANELGIGAAFAGVLKRGAESASKSGDHRLQKLAAKCTALLATTAQPARCTSLLAMAVSSAMSGMALTLPQVSMLVQSSAIWTVLGEATTSRIAVEFAVT